MSVQYLTYQEIDKAKWDKCISDAGNGLIYAHSFYLDTMAKNWDGMVYKDYEAVMPLPWNKKYGIYYLYQPPFTSNLGLFGTDLTAELLETFLHAIPEKFRYWDFSLNYKNFFKLKEFKLHERINFTLSLEEPYDSLYAGFRENIKRNIKRAEQYLLDIRKNIPLTPVIELAKEQSAHFSKITAADYNNFENLYHKLYQQKKAIAYGVYTPANQLIAGAVFFYSHNRTFYILVGNHPDGKTLGASHALINAFIKDHAGEELILDFEGSDIDSLAFYYSSFGATQERYSAIHLNRLPALAKWFKK